eukprot:m.97500 g.97500  ORF g.97500 m.97500 type:complete len:58 (-) comp51362_c0_seq2:1073-1246(-)
MSIKELAVGQACQLEAAAAAADPMEVRSDLRELALEVAPLLPEVKVKARLLVQESRC